MLDGSERYPATDELARTLDGLREVENRTRLALLQKLVEFDRAEAWREDGVHSLADWLVYRHGMSRRSAGELVRIAWALDGLPAICAAFAEGRLSWDRVVLLADLVPPDEDAQWAEEAQKYSFSQLEHIAKLSRRMRRNEAEKGLQRRYVRMGTDPLDGDFRLNARLPAADGAVVSKALKRIIETMPLATDGTYLPQAWRAADALVELASVRLAEDSDIDRATIVIHADASALNHMHGVAELEDGTPIAAEIARRLGCDARAQLVFHGSDGRVVGVGRTTRTVPPWLLRQLEQRDRGCRFADCGRTLGTQAHHKIHWAHGGRTDLDNLVTLCRYHHRLVHDGGWRLIADVAGNLRFVRPDGVPLRKSPIPLRPHQRERLRPPNRALRHRVAARC